MRLLVVDHPKAMVFCVCRNLFFRVSSLTLMGVKLVFVMEGEAPKLKAETMKKRTETRYGGFKKASAPKSTTNTSRGRFKAVLAEVGWSSSLLHLSLVSVTLSSCCCPSLASVVCTDVGLSGCAVGDGCWGGWGHVRPPGLPGPGGRLHH